MTKQQFETLTDVYELLGKAKEYPTYKGAREKLDLSRQKLRSVMKDAYSESDYYEFEADLSNGRAGLTYTFLARSFEEARAVIENYFNNHIKKGYEIIAIRKMINEEENNSNG